MTDDWIHDHEGIIDTHLYLDDLVYADTPQLCSHNAFASLSYGWDSHYMQYHDVVNQFYAGARCFMLDVYEENGELILLHNDNFKIFSGIGSRGSNYKDPLTFDDILRQINIIFKANDNAIITLVIENKGATHNQIKDSLSTTDLYKYTSSHDPNTPGLTFGQMRAHNSRLVVFAEEHNKQADLNIFSTDFYKETTYSLGDDKECIDRGEGRASFNNNSVNIFILNHFYKFSCHHSTKNPLWASLVSPECSIVNDYNEIMERVNKCNTTHNLTPTFIALDFIEEGKNGGGLKAIFDLMNSNLYNNLTTHSKSEGDFSSYRLPSLAHTLLTSSMTAILTTIYFKCYHIPKYYSPIKTKST